MDSGKCRDPPRLPLRTGTDTLKTSLPKASKQPHCSRNGSHTALGLGLPHAKRRKILALFLRLALALEFSSSDINVTTRRQSTIKIHKSFRTKQKLAKAQKQNRPVPQWIRLRTGNTIRSTTRRGGTGGRPASVSKRFAHPTTKREHITAESPPILDIPTSTTHRLSFSALDRNRFDYYHGLEPGRWGGMGVLFPLDG
ncbi:ribosomal l39 protein [Sarocladium implicatum]|nr:ribosomal l39 protein [Sarocladium implicatum]